MDENELFICSTFIDQDNFSILTTRQLATKESGQLRKADLHDAADKGHGHFKSFTEPVTFGNVQLQNGDEFRCFIETGNASMVMIHVLRTRIRTTEMSQSQVVKAGRIWNNKSEE